MKLFEVVKGAKSATDVLATGDGSRPQDRQDQCHGRQWRRLCRQPQPHAVWHRDDHHASRKARCPSRSTRSWSISAIRSGRSRPPTSPGSTSATTAASAAPRKTRTTANCRSPTRSSRPGRLGQKTGAGWFRYEPGDRTPHPDPEVAPHHQGEGRRVRLRAARVHRRGDPAPAAVRLGQRGLQDPRRGQGLPRQRHRRDVAERLRLSALSRRADVLGRRHRRRRGLPPDRRLAPALRRPLGPLAASCAVSPRPTPPSATPNPPPDVTSTVAGYGTVRRSAAFILASSNADAARAIERVRSNIRRCTPWRCRLRRRGLRRASAACRRQGWRRR